MSNSALKSNIREVFENMEYGSISESKSLGEKWLLKNADDFGPFINGKLSPQQSEASETKSTGVHSSVSLKLNNQQDYAAAVSASLSAFPKWSLTEGHSRAKILYSIARQLQKQISLISEVEALNRGTQVSSAREIDVPALIRIFYYYAGWAQLQDSELSAWEPLGPVVGVTSISAPLISFALFIAPALATGNTIVLLPNVSNCLSTLLLAQICSVSGVPPGVINVVPQEQLTMVRCPAVNDSRVKKVAVIGSPSLGRAILSSSELLHQSHTMLLDGCVPMIVLDSADLDAAIDCAIDAAWINQGQNPWSLRLIVVQEAGYESFKSKLASRVCSMQVGGAFDKMADISNCTVNTSLVRKLQDILKLEPNSEVVQPAGSNSASWAPTVIFSAAPPAASVLEAADECPVLYVVGARSAKEAIGIANHCGAGAAASIWTESSAFAWEAALQLKAGTVWINSHGTFDASVAIAGRNSSGFGSFLGKEGLLEFLQLGKEEQNLLPKFNPKVSSSLLPEDLRVDVSNMDQTYKLFYGGGHKRPNSNTYRTLLNSKGKLIAAVPEANRKDARNAVDAAVKAQPGWWKRGGHNRAQIIYNLAEKLQARRNHFASHLGGVYETGDTEQCLKEVDECTKVLFHYAASCDKPANAFGHISVGSMTVTMLREPLGVIAVICTVGECRALVDLIALVGAAIAFGNTCVLASHPDCPTPALELAQLLEAAEVPAGVVNILCGETGALLPTLCGHMEVHAVWCIGYQQKFSKMLLEESGKSNLKLIWALEEALSPLTLENRQVLEIKATRSKAVWLPAIASFGA